MANPHLSFFSRWAGFYESTPLLGRILRAQQDSAVERMNPVIGEKVLDLGCGPGRGLTALARRGAHAVGLDYSPDMLQGASQIAPVTRGSAVALPFKSGSFDAILCSNSFHHYPEPLACLREMRRVLKKGGRLILVDPNLDHPIARLIIYGGEAVMFGMDVHLHSAAGWRDLLFEAGFAQSYVEPLVPTVAQWALSLPAIKTQLARLPLVGALADPLAVSLCASAWA
jgi:ubiquinone/menaquinone biosynthesis C-methylase UbiE